MTRRRTLACAYVASKTRLAPMWQAFREEWRPRGLEVTSTWIDEAGPGESNMEVLWPRIIQQIERSQLLIAVHEPGDVWKGAYAEVGAALMAGCKVYFVGRPEGTLHHHPDVTFATSPDDALEDWRSRYMLREWLT